MKKEFEKDSYLYGRCHLYALLCSKITGYDMECMWDTEYWHDDAEHPSTVLVHAYVISSDGKKYDAGGLLTEERLEDDYEWNEALVERISPAQLKEMIRRNILEGFESGEQEKLERYIREQFSL